MRSFLSDFYDLSEHPDGYTVIASSRFNSSILIDIEITAYIEDRLIRQWKGFTVRMGISSSSYPFSPVTSESYGD